jgi:hypothetical protein
VHVVTLRKTTGPHQTARDFFGFSAGGTGPAVQEIANPDAQSGLYIKSRAGQTVKAAIPPDCVAFQARV